MGIVLTSFKDRNLSWSPDGTRLAFYSTRSGAWNLWTVRADGSALRRIADPPDTTAAAWSLDGQRLMVDLRDGSLGEVAADGFTAREEIRSIPLPEPLRRFELGGWSPSGELLGGTEADPNGALSIGAFEPAPGTYRRSQLPMAGAEWVHAWGKFAGWLPDSRHFVASGREQIAVVNVETGAWRGLQAVDERRLAVSHSRDGRTLLVEQESVDGDLWMLEIPGGEK